MEDTPVNVYPTWQAVKLLLNLQIVVGHRSQKTPLYYWYSRNCLEYVELQYSQSNNQNLCWERYTYVCTQAHTSTCTNSYKTYCREQIMYFTVSFQRCVAWWVNKLILILRLTRKPIICCTTFKNHGEYFSPTKHGLSSTETGGSPGGVLMMKLRLYKWN